MIPDDVSEDFYAGRKNERVRFSVNDGVEVLSGRHKGKVCAVITIEEVEPEVIYLVESGDNGSFLREAQRNLRPID
jgi:hypothetical protein